MAARVPTPQPIVAAIQDLIDQGATRNEIAAATGLHRTAINNICRTRGIVGMPAREVPKFASLVVIDAIQRMIDADATYSEIFEGASVSRKTIGMLFKSGAITRLPTRAKTEAVFAKRPHVPVPGWVPRDLRDDYRDIASLNGEERAARIVSAMKAEAMRAEV